MRRTSGQLIKDYGDHLNQKPVVLYKGKIISGLERKKIKHSMEMNGTTNIILIPYKPLSTLSRDIYFASIGAGFVAEYQNDQVKIEALGSRLGVDMLKGR